MNIKYLDIELMEKMCHKLAVAVFDTKEDPIARFHEHNELLDSALNLPKAGFGDVEQYPTLVDKATILYYTLNKNHPFRNGNKRIAAASLIVFLFINDMLLDAGINEVVDKTLYVAKSTMSEREKVLDEIKRWIEEHLVSISELKNIENNHENRT